jgi:DNA-binding protein H-NS
MISDQFQNIDLVRLYESPMNPRKRFDEQALAELTASVAAHGILQPILVRPDNTGKYEIVTGARRYRAAIAAGLQMMPAVIRAMTDEHNLKRQPEGLLAMAEALEIDAEVLLKDAKEAQKPAPKAKKSTKKVPSGTSEDHLPPSEAAQAQDCTREENPGGATEAAPAGDESPLEDQTPAPADAEAERQSSGSIEPNEKPIPDQPAYPIGSRVRILDEPTRVGGIPHVFGGKEGTIEAIYTDGRDRPITVRCGFDAAVFEAHHLELIESNEKPSGSTRVTIQYQHPEEATLQWTGRGRKPKWVENWLATGRTLEDLKIVGAAA